MWALAAGGFRAWFARSPRRLELIGGAGGLAIVAVGAGLLVSGPQGLTGGGRAVPTSTTCDDARARA